MEQQKTEHKSTPMQLVRLKAASEDYKVHKSIYIDTLTEERLEGFMEWSVFRDKFLIDWKSNRRVTTEKEADVHFDRIADESLAELENIGAPTDVAALADQVAADLPSDEASDEIPVPATAPTAEAPVATAPKRRGRPPGKAKLTVVASNDDAPVAAKRRGRPPGSGKKATTTSKPALKVAAKKKGGGTSAKAEAIVAKYGLAGRGWSRKDVIAKLTSSVKGLGAAYASTLYQKFAK